MNQAGPLAYLVDTSIESGHGPLRVLPIDDSDQRKLHVPLSVGQTLAYRGVSVMFVSEHANAVTLEIVRP